MSPNQLEILEPVNPKVRVRVRGMRKDASTLNEKNTRVEVDLSLASAGRRTFSLTRDHIFLSREGISVVSIDPSELKYKFQLKSENKTPR